MESQPRSTGLGNALHRPTTWSTSLTFYPSRHNKPTKSQRWHTAISAIENDFNLIRVRCLDVRFDIELRFNQRQPRPNPYTSEYVSCTFVCGEYCSDRVSDYSTSFPLDRPLAIWPNNTNTPHSMWLGVGELFFPSHPIAQRQTWPIHGTAPRGRSIQIRPCVIQTGSSRAWLSEFCRQLPDRYRR